MDTGNKQQYSLLVISNPVAGQEDAFNQWYSDQHLQDVLEVPGFVAAQRFEVTEEDHSLPGPYVAIYDIETDDPQMAMTALQAAVSDGSMVISDALDAESTTATMLRAITPRLIAD